MARGPSGRPTSFDIAYLAGVSQPTVSRALRGDRSISATTRDRIHKIANELNYAVDKNLGSQRGRRTNTIALLFFEGGIDETLIDPFFLAMLGSVTRACANHGLDLLIRFQRMEDNWPVLYQDSKLADGLILLGCDDYSLYSEHTERLVAQGTPFARWGAGAGTSVGSDNFRAGRIVGEHLLQTGRRRIAFLGHTDAHHPELERRYEGLCAALREAGVAPDPALHHDTLPGEDAGYRAASALIASGTPFDAIFAPSDLTAIGAMRALAGASLKIPEDVAVVGFGNIPAGRLTTPPLTTIQEDIAGAGERLVETVLAQIDGRQPPAPSLPSKLIVRESTRAA